MATETEDAHEAAELTILASALTGDAEALLGLLTSSVTQSAARLLAAETPELSVAPNPARGQASIILTLETPAHVRLAVYDLLGRELALIYDGPLELGSHVLQFDGGALRAGIYVVRAVVEPEGGTARTMTRRLTLLD